MLKVYALLINKWVNELYVGVWDGTIEHMEKFEQKQKEYTSKMNKLYKRLQREHGFDKEKFYALQDQALMM
jgi:hypothetical protein